MYEEPPAVVWAVKTCYRSYSYPTRDEAKQPVYPGSRPERKKFNMYSPFWPRSSGGNRDCIGRCTLFNRTLLAIINGGTVKDFMDRLDC